MNLCLKELTEKTEILQTYNIYSPCMFMPTPEKFERKVEVFLRDKSIKYFVCLNGETIIGVMSVLFLSPDKAEIIGIAVDENFQRKGIGSFMIKELISKNKLSFVYAETDSDAVEFYRKNGFSIEQFTKTFVGETITRYKCEL